MTRIVLEDFISQPLTASEPALVPVNATHFAYGFAALVAVGLAFIAVSTRSTPTAEVSQAPATLPLVPAQASTGRAHLATPAATPAQLTMPLARTGRVNPPVERPPGGLARHGYGLRPLPILGPGR